MNLYKEPTAFTQVGTHGSPYSLYLSGTVHIHVHVLCNKVTYMYIYMYICTCVCSKCM